MKKSFIFYDARSIHRLISKGNNIHSFVSCDFSYVGVYLSWKGKYAIISNMDRKRMYVEEEENNNSEIKHSLQVLANGITELQASLMKPKERKPNLKDIEKKVDIILEILKSWDTSSTAYSQLQEEVKQERQ